MKPKEIKKLAEGLEVTWSDGRSEFFKFARLRTSCACAVCRELKVPLNDSMPFFPRAITLVQMELVGNYAVALTWGDGHRSIFAFDRLIAPEISEAQIEERT